MDGRYLATLDNSLVRLWDLKGEEIARVPDALNAPPVLSPDARFLAAWSESTVRVWPLSPEELIQIACAKLGAAQLSEDDWSELVPEVPLDERACALGRKDVFRTRYRDSGRPGQRRLAHEHGPLRDCVAGS
jgi:hypothetical protein